jgi:hypothetical protein
MKVKPEGALLGLRWLAVQFAYASWLEIHQAAWALPALGLRASRRLAEIRPGSRDSGYVRAFQTVGGAAVEAAAAESLADREAQG